MVGYEVWYRITVFCAKSRLMGHYFCEAKNKATQSPAPLERNKRTERGHIPTTSVRFAYVFFLGYGVIHPMQQRPRRCVNLGRSCAIRIVRGNQFGA